MQVDAKLVKTLRQSSGAGMMDCKRALAANDNNIEKASEYLRKKGLASADKKAGRVASEGAIGAYIHAGSKCVSCTSGPLHCLGPLLLDLRPRDHDAGFQLSLLAGVARWPYATGDHRIWLCTNCAVWAAYCWVRIHCLAAGPNLALNLSQPAPFISRYNCC